MEITVGKVLYYKRFYLKKHKRIDLQFSWKFWIEFLVRLNLNGCSRHQNFEVNILDVLMLDIDHDSRCDHAGWHIKLNLLGLYFCFHYEDTRHWDYGTSDFEIED